MRAKDFIPASKPRNPVVRQQQTSGAGAHRDKKKEQKQGYEKHKSKSVEEALLDQTKRMQLIRFLAKKMNWEINYLELASDSELISWYKKVQAGKDPMKEAVDFETRRKGKTPAELGGADAWYHRNLGPEYYGFAPGSPEAIEYKKAYAEWDEGPSGGKQWESTEMEGRHGYDDAGFSLAPGHDEGEPVYNPHYDRTGQYDRKAKYSQDYNYRTGKPLGAASEKKGFIFYNVNDTQVAQNLGLKQTKSGKWYVPTGDAFRQRAADKIFGPGRVWYPKD